MTISTERQQFAEQNGMTMEFVNWFFDTKKEGCGNAWFIMAAAAWEGWKGKAELLAVREAQSVPAYYVLVDGDDYEFNSHNEFSCGRRGGTPLFTAPPAPAVPDWKHISNEWADVATSALVWLNNIADGISTPQVAIKNTELGIAACRAAMLKNEN